MDETKEIEIDFRKIFYMMRDKVVYIIICTILLGTLAGCFTHFFITPKYTANVKYYVYSNTDRISSDASISQNEIMASQDLINTYIAILSSDTVLDKVAEDLSINTNASKLRKLISSTWIEDTQIFQVVVQTTNPETSAEIANSIAKIAPAEINRIVKAGGVEIVDYAKVPKSPSSPNTKMNIIIGALAGFFISFLGFFVYELFDSTIASAKDLERDFEIPILGTIPRLDETDDAPTDNRIKSINNMDSDFKKASAKPSDTLLETLQSMKGDDKND